MSQARFSLLALVASLLLAGCGQSGPLYMPGNPSQMTVPAEEPAEADDDENDEADDRDDE